MKNKSKSPIITLTTDFGGNDYFVGVMKGVILKINPQVEIIDITNNISSFKVTEGAFLLSNFYSYFPKKTIHLAVVDPGVGSKRRAVIAKTKDYIFIAPDNGILSYVYRKEKKFSVYDITNEKYFLKPISQTFHGRDIFAPVAGYLSKGISPAKFGENIKDFAHFSVKEPIAEKNFISGDIIYSDHFGNLITNISRNDFDYSLKQTKYKVFKIIINNLRINAISKSYSTGKADKLSAVWGSHGYLELFLKNSNASSRFKIKPEKKVNVFFS